ncbi:unnamed protein product [Polarella glacialis]|uniref:glutathione transferase n=1 Tax=Polarella glacialis TaxID=89957 RepID=A0A813LB13_POLGL|nr:unnamed protein product [Polarella glacialis]
MALQLHYFACRSRGEPIRLVLALAGAEWEERSVPEQQANGRRQMPPPPSGRSPQYLEGAAGDLSNPDAFCFGTCPKLVDGDLELVQSNAILRHLGRRFGLYGSSASDTAAIDMWIDGCEDARQAYNELIYGLDGPPFRDDLSNESPEVAAALAEYAPKAAAVLAPFERRLRSGPREYMVGAAATIADVAVMDIFDVHVHLWGESSLRDSPGGPFEHLHAHRGRVASLGGVAEYLASDRRWGRINGNLLG